ncbi:Dynein regulatory complex subunit 4 [Coccomyxa sp. Obi]|nr:Dynein regulatory complex subunit 4 [Coccomyxa sp. Obi]
MPPKMSKASAAKEAREKEKKQKAALAAEGGVSFEELTLQIQNLQAEKKAEEETRNRMQLERDKIQSFWDITRKELDNCRAELRNKDREIEDLQDRHQVEIKVYKQRVKHLMYEHQNSIAVLKADAELRTKQAAEEAAGREQHLLADQRSLQQRLREMEVAHAEGLRLAQLEHSKQESKMRLEVESTAKQLAEKYEARTRANTEEADARRRTEVAEVEERGNAHVQDLMQQHTKAFADMRAYYNGITSSNLDLIKSLKDEAVELRRRDVAAAKLVSQVTAENKRLVEPLAQAQKTVEEQRIALGGMAKLQGTAAQTKARLMDAHKRLKSLGWEHEVLEQRFGRLEAERDTLRAALEALEDKGFQVAAPA